MFKFTPSYLKYPLAGLALTGALFYPAKAHAQLEIKTTVAKSNRGSNTGEATDIFIKNNQDDIIVNSSRNYFSTSPQYKSKFKQKEEPKISSKSEIHRDTEIEYTNKKTQVETDKSELTPKGTSNPEILSKAPSPRVQVQGKMKIAKFVVNLSNNVLYEYDEIGNTQRAYLIASGKKSTPTHTGVRVVSHVERYPYRTAPSTTKRYKHPKDYGPKIIILNNLDTKTGETSDIGEFIHGNRNPELLGQYVSGGCMRMDNDVILELAAKVKRGDIVVIKR